MAVARLVKELHRETECGDRVSSIHACNRLVQGSKSHAFLVVLLSLSKHTPG
jgi:hypothetical protein